MGTTAEKLAYLKESKNAIKTALETPSNVMRDYADWIKKYVQNQPTSIVNDGICKNALDVPLVSLGVDGNSGQKQYEGYNKLPYPYINKTQTINGITFAVNDNGTVIVNGTAKNNTYFYLNKLSFSANQSYHISGCPADGSYTSYALFIENGPMDYGKGNTFTPTSDVSNYVGIKIGAGTTVNNLLFKPMLTIEANKTGYDKWEPYIGGQPSPNPDYPQDIEVITECSLQQSGKNLAYDGWAEDCAKRIGALVNFNIPNQLWWNASAGYGDYDNKYIFKTNWKKNTQYTFNVDLKNISSTSSNLAIEYTDGTETIFGKLIQGEFTNLVLTSEPNKTIKYLRSKYLSGATSIKLDTFMIYEGTESTPYEPYHEPKVIPINLNGNSIAKVGDVKDLLKIYRNGDVEIEKKIGKVVLDGSDDEEWQISTALHDNFTRFIINAPSIAGQNKAISTHFKIGDTSSASVINVLEYRDTNKILINTNVASSVNTFKSWLSAHNIILKYQLETPETIKLPSMEPITLWEGTNIFKLITNLDTTFEMEYVVNKDYLETQNLLNIVEGENI